MKLRIAIMAFDICLLFWNGFFTVNYLRRNYLAQAALHGLFCCILLLCIILLFGKVMS